METGHSGDDREDPIIWPLVLAGTGGFSGSQDDDHDGLSLLDLIGLLKSCLARPFAAGKLRAMARHAR